MWPYRISEADLDFGRDWWVGVWDLKSRTCEFVMDFREVEELSYSDRYGLLFRCLSILDCAGCTMLFWSCSLISVIVCFIGILTFGTPVSPFWNTIFGSGFLIEL